MFKNISISTKITGLVVVIVLIALLVISYMAYWLNKSDVQDSYSQNLKVVAEAQAVKVDAIFSNLVNSIEFLQASKTILEGTIASESSTENSDFGFGDPFGSGDVDDPFAEEESGSFDDFGLEAPDFGTTEPTREAVYDVQGYLNTIKSSFGFKDIFITETTGKVRFSTYSNIGAGSN